jgi:transposase
MPNFKPKSFPQGIFAPVFLCRQIQPGTFEFTLCKLIDHVLDLSVFEQKYGNDKTGAPAYDPRALLKVIFLAYSRGIISSRRIADECRENILFMAMSGNSRPHHTTIANFVSSMCLQVKDLFLQVLLVCDRRGLIGREMFAIDGCKLPSNASKEWSGTQADFKRKKKKLETAIERILENHRQQDSSSETQAAKERDLAYITSLQKDLDKISRFIEQNDDRIGLTGKAIKSNITDNESAKIHTSKGVIQGYAGIATVDKKHQIIVNAEAFGQGSEKDLLIPSIESTRENFATIGDKKNTLKGVRIVADNGFHSEKNMAYLFSKNIDGYVADKEYRRRDIRFTSSERYRELQKRNVKKGKKFTPANFTFPVDLSYCICPAGQRLYRSGGNTKVKDYQAVKFKGPKSACVPCALRRRCLRKPEKTEIRQVAYLTGKRRNGSERFTEKMKAKIDTEHGRAVYGLRLAVGEPPFANIRSNLRLDRFSLRGKKKVNTQWNLFCILHNLMKIHKYGGSFT